MWTHARALAALGRGCPTRTRSTCSSTKPILLPGKVGFATDGSAFAVTNRDGKPYLTGSITPA